MMVGFLVDASFIVLVLRPSLLLWAFWISQSFMYSTKTRQTASSKLIKAYGIIKVVNSEKILKFFFSLWILLLLHMSLFHGTLICNFINKMNYREIQIRFLLSHSTYYYDALHNSWSLEKKFQVRERTDTTCQRVSKIMFGKSQESVTKSLS